MLGGHAEAACSGQGKKACPLASLGRNIGGPVARIPYPDLDKADPQVREMLGRLPAPANIFTMLAHAPTCVKPVMKLGGTLLGKLQLDPKLRELCLLYAVSRVGGDYEWMQHLPIARDLGCGQAQITALEHHDDGAACFDARSGQRSASPASSSWPIAPPRRRSARSSST